MAANLNVAQHDSRVLAFSVREAIGHDEYTVFDDESGGGGLLRYSRVVTVTLDLAAKVATLVQSVKQPEGMVATAEGNGTGGSDLEEDLRFHLLTAFAGHGPDGGGEPLAIMLRPGNPGSNTAADHIQVTRLALAQLPRHLRRQVLIRADSGGGTQEFLAWLAGLAHAGLLERERQGVRAGIQVADASADADLPVGRRDLVADDHQPRTRRRAGSPSRTASQAAAAAGRGQAPSPSRWRRPSPT